MTLPSSVIVVITPGSVVTSPGRVVTSPGKVVTFPGSVNVVTTVVGTWRELEMIFMLGWDAVLTSVIIVERLVSVVEM